MIEVKVKVFGWSGKSETVSGQSGSEWMMVQTNGNMDKLLKNLVKMKPYLESIFTDFQRSRLNSDIIILVNGKAIGPIKDVNLTSKDEVVILMVAAGG